MRALLASGADPNCSGGVHDRPLHIAASKTQFSIVNILLEAGGDRESSPIFKWKILTIFAFQQASQTMKEILHCILPQKWVIPLLLIIC